MVPFDKLNEAIGLGTKGPLQGNLTLGGIVSAVLPYLFAGAGLLLLFYLIWGGFSLMLSRGDPKAVESAKGRITNAIIGFVIIFVAYWLVQFLGQILGIGQFTPIFGK